MIQNNKAVLTDEQIQKAWHDMPGGPGGWLKEFGFLQFARAIEAAVLASKQQEVDDLRTASNDLINRSIVSGIERGRASADNPSTACADPVAALTPEGRAVKWNPNFTEELWVKKGYRPLYLAAPVAQSTAGAAKGQRENKELARILFGMIEGGAVDRDTNIYADDYQAGDGDTYVYRAAEVLVEQDAEIDMLIATINLLSEKLAAAPALNPSEVLQDDCDHDFGRVGLACPECGVIPSKADPRQAKKSGLKGA